MSINSRDSSQVGDLSEDKVYEFGRFRLDISQGLLLFGSEPVKVPRKTFELLVYLLAHRNRILDKSRLMSEVWPGSFVEEANLTVHIAKLRKILAADESAASIETFPKVGYRFNADVRAVSNHPGTNDPVPETPEFSVAAAEQSPSRHGSWKVVTVGVALILIIVLFGGGYLLWDWTGKSSPRVISMNRVPGTEQSSSIALSPSGEYIAHAVSRGGKRTLTMTHVAVGSSVQLLPPDDALFLGMTFSKDGTLLYFVKQLGEQRTLYRMPFLGGPVTKVLDNVNNKISFSPSGEEFCFVRNTSKNETAIMAARADGAHERVIRARKAPDFYSSYELAWSPDGKMIANVAGTRGKDRGAQIVGVDVESGQERLLSDSAWAAGDGLEWLSDGSGLIAGLFEESNSPTQVWFVPLPSGEPQRITNDVNNYGSVGISTDGKTIMAGQFTDQSSLWIIPPTGFEDARPVTAAKHHLFRWVRWTPEGRLLFASSSEGRRDVWVMNADGTGERKLTSGPSANIMPVAVPGSGHIVFASTRDDSGSFELWRANAEDGGELVQLTNGAPGGSTQPVVTSDGEWIYYTSGQMDGPPLDRRVWRIPASGGPAVQFIPEPSYAPDVSPDGKYLAAWLKSSGDTPWRVAILPIEGGLPVRLLDIPQTNAIQWTPDGKAISYVRTTDGISNVWIQNIDGGEPRQVTKFTAEQVVNIDWSNDGRLVCSRIYKSRDVVLIRNFR